MTAYCGGRPSTLNVNHHVVCLYERVCVQRTQTPSNLKKVQWCHIDPTPAFLFVILHLVRKPVLVQEVLATAVDLIPCGMHTRGTKSLRILVVRLGEKTCSCSLFLRYQRVPEEVLARVKVVVASVMFFTKDRGAMYAWLDVAEAMLTPTHYRQQQTRNTHCPMGCLHCRGVA